MSSPRPDLQELRDRLTIMWSFLRPLMEREPFGPATEEAKVGFIQSMNEVVDRVKAGRSLRELRELLRTFKEMIGGLRPEQINEVEWLLAQRFGPTAALDGDDAARRERIVKRGRIRTADEYRLISARVEAIYADAAHREELEALTRILADVAARRAKWPAG